MTDSTLSPPLVPTIDISPYLASPTSAKAQKVISAVRDACTTTGFFQLVGHGIPRKLQDAVFEGSAALFNLPAKEKLKLDRSHSVGASNRAYELFGGEELQGGKLPDLKEVRPPLSSFPVTLPNSRISENGNDDWLPHQGFYIGQDIPVTDPRIQANAFLMGPNLWPTPTLLPESLFRHPMEQYYSLLFTLSLSILKIIAAGMPYGPTVFSEFTSNDAVASVLLLHYPPDTSSNPLQFGAAAHTDFGALTLLLQDEIGGLQVWDSEKQGWVDVPPNRDAYVFNVGDMLQMWTGGAL